MLISFLTWLGSVILFLLLIPNTSPDNGIMFLTIFFIGTIAFVIFLFQLAKKNPFYSLLALIGLPGITLVAFLMKTNSAQQISPSQIECFINGKSVFTTRENCQELSIQKPQSPPVVNVEQPRPQIQIPIIQPPEPPLRCKTQYFMGSPEVVCEKSWF